MNSRQGRCSASAPPFCFYLALAFLVSFPHFSLSYQNFTVGDSNGWTYPTTNVVDYQKWTTGKNFSLGDFLLFNYPQKEHDVILTYNETVYKACDYESSNDNDYEVWGEAGTTTYSAIPLVQTGMTYFFCSAYSGDHCRGGMKFSINVSHGEGLPASLMIPPPAPTDNTPTDSTPSTVTPTVITPTSASDQSSLPSSSSRSIPSMILIQVAAVLLAPFMVLGAFV